MDAEAQGVYQAQAVHENHVRAEASLQPFLPKVADFTVDHVPGPAFDAAAMLGKNGLKTVSKQRTLVTYQNYKQSSLWKGHCAGLATADGALGLDLIDVQSSQEDLTATWQCFAQSEPKQDPFPPQEDGEIHHSACWSNHGCCKKVLKKDVVLAMVFSLADHLESRA